ncbi:3-isopropylmalate dehydratase small subunit [Cytobacillus sp. S13-E01]|uniref:3-isopropylmalate dehydratase small subunit n=1 Tax=Cytobacillus sp. S13-E01 TaxID=3031326 RepID=UPI0023D84419|nr:3-isopropylmalate dehydratase small subunit [Cytobacillus sp. S13-E01]MDF0726729.1 3-isopropylmalate dehydratase small subunit [Cytobacillus sp. S13-E01]
MSSIKVHTGKVAGLNRTNVDTDQIIPKQFLKRIERTGFGQFLFYNWRYNQDGILNSDFELNRPENAGASILVSSYNFGCGSSREHAPWALLDYGFHVVIAPSFADIFYNNCLKNGIVPVVLHSDDTNYLLERSLDKDYQCTVSLDEQRVFDSFGFEKTFEIDQHWKSMLVNGLDEIGLTLSYEEQITNFEQKSTTN